MNRTGKSSKGGARKSAGKPLLLAEVLDLTAAAPLAQAILARRGSALSLDASKVHRVGAQCLQVLLAAAQTWRTDGMRLSLDKPSEEFVEGSRLLGITLDQHLAEAEAAR